MIKFADLTLDPTKHVDLLADIRDVVVSGQYIYGKHAQAFEEEWAGYCKTTHCLVTKSGTAALVAILRGLPTKIEHVIVPAATFAATGFAVKLAGLEPIVVDVEKDGLMNQDICRKVLQTFSGRCAVLFVHLYGQFGVISQDILKMAPVIEDACQAHGLKGVQGVAAAFSFFPGKNLGALGDGGAVVTDDGAVDLFARRFSRYGDDPGQKYQHKTLGDNLRMDEIQAAFLRRKLPRLDSMTQKRRNIARIYQEEGIETYARLHNSSRSSYHLYPVLVEAPEESQRRMRLAGVETGNQYPYTLASVLGNCEGYSNAERISNHVLTLPIGPHISTGEAFEVVRSFHQIHRSGNGWWRLR